MVNCIKSNGYDIATVRKLNHAGSNTQTNNILLLLLEPIFNAYCKYLADHKEIDFNDIRTTLQALYAIYDNCNSLHTNAYDEAITTPTEESVRRAMAIQLIINKELGLAKNENPLQGSFIIEELTELVEEDVYTEFDRITERGGVLGAMETMYQLSLIHIVEPTRRYAI